jgi:predicted nucleic acid-binding protein
VRGEVAKIEEFCSIMPESVDVYTEWKRLVSFHRVTGVQVHDARLVAAMNVYGIDRILTFNGSDFSRYPIKVITPS